MKASLIVGLFASFAALFLRLMRCASKVITINGRKSMVSGGIPSMLIHFPPNILRMGLLNLSAIRYIAGTMINVMKKAKARPKMIVQLSGLQKATLSPPKKICGFNSLNRVTKLMLKPRQWE